ncbi:hypothetical protein DSCA_02200 [Desulfosarcina alkanivorans]|uniref:Anti-bacteriophage protein A/HamA C-terminal domain-containing protein n=1 Tax=Desulfosarcina alkanivorans TaxID=571177 RepID=A0A5K7YE69_9BACT|nr:DUF1837 domain-containing protein [Desulfosarcina alkanivorans]BBO66290.1 hypothetical protein DSCA_02200 [Desulfosarcina alkanivorans]
MVTEPIQITELSKYLEVAREKYDACMSRMDLPIQIDGENAVARFKYVKFDKNGQPKFKDLAECLADHITQYCFSVRRRQRAMSEADRNRLYREAKKLMRSYATSGEAGELLLYFLLEAVLEAPQLVAKMDLKTSTAMEIHGSDGIHMRWDDSANCMDIYFGEAKLYSNISKALDSAFESITSFHNNRQTDRELNIVTSHCKWADKKTKNIVLRYVDRLDPIDDCRFNHACLIGYDWKKYKKLNDNQRTTFLTNFIEDYSKDIPRLIKLLKRRFEKFEFCEFKFEIFFLPFRSVQEFRDEFTKAL